MTEQLASFPLVWKTFLIIVVFGGVVLLLRSLSSKTSWNHFATLNTKTTPKIGYARVSTGNQSEELQALERAGCFQICTGHGRPGRAMDRPS